MIIEFSLLTVMIIFVVLVAIFLRKLLVLVINSVIGFFALFAAKLLLPDLTINFWSIIITAIGGIIGFLAVIILHLFGVAF